MVKIHESIIVSEGFKGGTRGAPIVPRDAVSRTANVERNGGHKWVNTIQQSAAAKIFREKQQLETKGMN